MEEPIVERAAANMPELKSSDAFCGAPATGWWTRTGPSNEWYFGRSRFVAGMDSEFDYRAERSKRLSEIQAKRQREIAF